MDRNSSRACTDSWARASARRRTSISWFNLPNSRLFSSEMAICDDSSVSTLSRAAVKVCGTRLFSRYSTPMARVWWRMGSARADFTLCSRR